MKIGICPCCFLKVEIISNILTPRSLKLAYTKKSSVTLKMQLRRDFLQCNCGTFITFEICHFFSIRPKNGFGVLFVWVPGKKMDKSSESSFFAPISSFKVNRKLGNLEFSPRVEKSTQTKNRIEDMIKTKFFDRFDFWRKAPFFS